MLRTFVGAGVAGVGVAAATLFFGLQAFLLPVSRWEVAAKPPLSAGDAGAVALVLERRTASVGFGRASAAVQPDGSIVVELRGPLPPAGDIEWVLTAPGLVEFLPVAREGDDVAASPGSGEVLLADPTSFRAMLVLSRAEGVGALTFAGAETGFEEGHSLIRIRPAPESAQKLRTFSQRNVGRRVAIVVDGGVVAAPVVHDEVGAAIQIDLPPEASFGRAVELAAILAGGPLPERARLSARRALAD